MRYMLSSLMLLAACASPAPGFIGSPRHDVRIEGVDFAVFLRPDEAEVIRLGYLARRERDRIPALMMQAAEQVSGCRAIPYSLSTRIPGDTGEGRVNLDC